MHSMNSMNQYWPYRHPYPPTASPAQQNQVSSSATAAAPAASELPYPNAHAANPSSYTASFPYPQNPAAPTSYSSSTYATQTAFQTSSQAGTGTNYSSPATATHNPNYAPTVSNQRQPNSVDSIAPQGSSRPTAPGTPHSATGSTSYTSANTTNYSRGSIANASAPSQSQNTPQPSRQEDQRSSKNNSYSVAPAQPSSSASKTPQAQVSSAVVSAPKRKSMGRLGDADVHSAFVEYRNKDTDKCLSARCVHCNSVRAKNTSRQRQHLLECQQYLAYMRENHPNHQILEMAEQHAQGLPMKEIVKSSGGNGGGAGGGGGGGGGSGSSVGPVGNSTPMNSTNMNGAMNTPNGHAVPNGTPTQSVKRPKTDHHQPPDGIVIASTHGTGFSGNSVAPAHSLPVPKLERDFQLAIQLNPRFDIGKATWGQKHWTSYVSGHWNGRWGKGTVVPGGQDVQTSTAEGCTQTESRFLLQTHDYPPAYISVRMDGWRVGGRDVLERLLDPTQIDSVDPRTYSHRCFISMECGDERFKELNTAMWLGTVVRKTTEVIYDAYRIS